MAFNYQLVIIGAGSAGLAAADLAAQLGFTKVAVVEQQNQLGGECLHAGCVPSKALLHAAKNNYKNPWQHVKKSIDYIEDRSDNDEHLQKQGLKVYHGAAKFINKNSLSVGTQNISSRYFLIATGSVPVVPNIENIENVSYYTNETIFNLSSNPKSLAIMGGGPIGCEMAVAFALLGTKVTLIQSGDRLLPREEESVSNFLKTKLKELGVKVLLNARTIKAEITNQEVTLTLSQNNAEQKLNSQKLLLAVGRTPVTDNLGLENAKVKASPKGIPTNKYFQTNIKNIYAVGDCTTSPKFTHLAAHQAGVAIRNMAVPIIKKGGQHLEVVPWITYVQPEVGQIGLTEAEAAEKNLNYQTFQIDISEIDRAITNDAAEGFVKVIVDKSGMLLGATVVAENAGELLAPLSHIYYHKQSLDSLATTVMPYPTLASGLNLLAAKYSAEKAKSNRFFRQITKNWR